MVGQDGDPVAALLQERAQVQGAGQRRRRAAFMQAIAIRDRGQRIGDVLTRQGLAVSAVRQTLAVDKDENLIQGAVTADRPVQAPAQDCRVNDIGVVKEQVSEVNVCVLRLADVDSVRDLFAGQRINEAAALGAEHLGRIVGAVDAAYRFSIDILLVKVKHAASIPAPVKLLPAVRDRIIVGVAAAVHIDGALENMADLPECAGRVIATCTPGRQHPLAQLGVN